MENAEEVLQCLDSFSKLKPKDIPRELEEYLCFVARTGDPVYQWSLIKFLFREKLLHVLTDFHDNSPGLEIPPCPNVDPFNYDTLKNCLLEKIEAFSSAPFTVQRICELLTTPRKQYNRIDKYMRAIEKNILVVSTREPGQRRSESENGDPLDIVVNGDASDVHVEIEMEDSAWREADSTIADTTITAGSGDFNLISETADAIVAPTTSIESVITCQPIENTDQTSIILLNENTEAPILEQTVSCIETVPPIEPVQLVNEITVDETIVAEIDNITDPIEVMNVTEDVINEELEESATKTEFESKVEEVDITIDYIEQPQVDITSAESQETLLPDVELTLDPVAATPLSEVEIPKSEAIVESPLEKECNLFENILIKPISSPKASDAIVDVKPIEEVEQVEVSDTLNLSESEKDIDLVEIVKGKEDTVKNVVDSIVPEEQVVGVETESSDCQEQSEITTEVTPEKTEPDIIPDKVVDHALSEKSELDIITDKSELGVVETVLEPSQEVIKSTEAIIDDVENISGEADLKSDLNIQSDIEPKEEDVISSSMPVEVETPIEETLVQSKPEEPTTENITEIIETLPADENITELEIESENVVPIVPEPQEMAMEVEESDSNPPAEPMDQ